MNFSDTVVSYIRTYTPALAGLVIGGLVAWGLPVSGGTKDALTAVLSGLFIAAWYAGVRWAERRWPQMGWLLGVPRQPTYLAGTGPMPVQPYTVADQPGTYTTGTTTVTGLTAADGTVPPAGQSAP